MGKTRQGYRFWWVLGLVALSLTACDPFLYGTPFGRSSESESIQTTGKAETTTRTRPGPAPEKLADLASQLEALQARIQVLEGQVEENRYRLQRLQKTRESRIEPKLQRPAALEKKLSTSEKPRVSPEEQSGMRPEAAPPVPAAPSASAAPPGTPGPVSPPSETTKVAAVGPKTEDIKVFRDGMALFNKKSYKAARKKFNQYLQDHPQGSKATEARYFLADTFYQERRLDEAIIEFDKVVDQNPQSLLAPPALLKQAYAFKAQGKTKVYKLILEKLVDDYPHSAAAQQARNLLSAPPTAPVKARIKEKGE